MFSCGVGGCCCRFGLVCGWCLMLVAVDVVIACGCLFVLVLVFVDGVFALVVACGLICLAVEYCLVVYLIVLIVTFLITFVLF